MDVRVTRYQTSVANAIMDTKQNSCNINIISPGVLIIHNRYHSVCFACATANK